MKKKILIISISVIIAGLIVGWVFQLSLSTRSDLPGDETEHTHSFGAWAIERQPTCAEAGSQIRACDCGETQTEILPASGHITGEWITDREATCTQKGRKHQVCATCGTTLKNGVLLLQNHTSSGWLLDAAPTVYACGQRHEECTVCHSILSTEVVPKSDPILASGDTRGPVLKSLSISGDKVSAGDVLTVTAEVEDDSSLFGAEITFVSGGDVRTLALQPQNDHLFTGELAITGDFVKGTYSITRISLTDYLHNESNPTNAASFSVQYTNSPLVDYVKLSPNHSGQRTHAIDTITIHCVVGQASVESLGNVFAPTSRQASSNYGVGFDGRIGMYVEEKNRSWCSSSRTNDQRAITIEVASDTTEPYAVTEAAYEATIRLVADICLRNGIKKLVWSTDKNTRVNHLDGCNMTVHRDFANTSCPGTYLYNRMGDIAKRVNALLEAASY